MRLSHDLIVERNGGIDILPKGTEIIIESKPIELQTKLNTLTCYYTTVALNKAVFVLTDEVPPWLLADQSVDINTLSDSDFDDEDQFSRIDKNFTKTIVYIDDHALAKLRKTNAHGRPDVLSGPELFVRMAFKLDPQQIMITTDPKLETNDDLMYQKMLFVTIHQNIIFYNNWDRYIKDMSSELGFTE